MIQHPIESFSLKKAFHFKLLCSNYLANNGMKYSCYEQLNKPWIHHCGFVHITSFMTQHTKVDNVKV